MGELVDEGDVGLAGEHGIEVELVECHPAMLDDAPGQHLESIELLLRCGPAVGLDDSDDDIASGCLEPAPFLEHREGLTDAGRGTEQYAQAPSAHAVTLHRLDYFSVASAAFSSSTLTVGALR
jgi:hypothetical protein